MTFSVSRKVPLWKSWLYPKWRKLHVGGRYLWRCPNCPWASISEIAVEQHIEDIHIWGEEG